MLQKAGSVCVRVDGSGILDKFSLIKLFFWKKRIIWEVHGFPEENHKAHVDRSRRLLSAKINFRRKALSLFVSKYLFVTKELEKFSRQKLLPRESVIINNFFPSILFPKKTSIPLSENLLTEHVPNKERVFKVVWTGNAKLSWQGLSILEKVAKKIYRVDPTITFIVAGLESLERFSWTKNIISLGFLDKKASLDLVSSCDVGLALYTKPPHTPFYFSPLKVLDYMVLKKPIIATNFRTVRGLVGGLDNALITNNEVSDIVRKVILLKRNNKLRKKLRENAYSEVRKRHNGSEAIILYRAVFH